MVLEARALEGAPEPLLHWTSRLWLWGNGQERLLLRLSCTPVKICLKEFNQLFSGVQAASLGLERGLAGGGRSGAHSRPR